ncbi:MAG: MMPL family transporter [Mesotoga infera]|jgi:hypothetical protein
MIKLVSFATLTAVVVVLFLGIDGLYFEPSPGSFLSEDDPELMAFSRVAREFGDTGTVMVVLNSSGLSLEKLKEVTQKIDGLDWVNTVASVFDAVELGKLNLLTLQIPKTEYVYQSGEKLVLNMDILNDPFYRDLIISSDGEYYGVLITVASGNEFKSGSNILSLKATLKELGINEYRLIGESVANSTTFRSIMDLTFVYPPFIFLAIFTVYMVKFRRISLALLTLVPPAGAAVLVVGIMGLIKTQINSLTVMIPSFIVIIGSAYGMHFLSRFQENCAKQENPIRRTIHEERVPILFSALTTMAGFSSYILLDMRAFRDMGILVCVGIFSSAVFTLIILPGLVSTKWCASVVLTASPVEISPKIRKALMWVIVVMSAISPLLIMTIPMNIDQYAFFKENSEIRRNAEKMKEAFGWLTNYTLMITPKGGGKLAITGEQASQLVDFQKELEALEGISKVLSPVDISRQTNIPLPLLIRVLDNTGVLGSATSLMISQRAMRINLFSPTSDSLSAEKLKDSVKELIARYPLLDEKFDFTLAGTTLIWKSVNSSVVSNQIQSLVVSFALILLLLFTIFKSVKSTFIATIPIALTTLFNFIFMALFRISLSISTALISGMLMGLVIDYAIHFTIWLRRFGDPERAYHQTAAAIFTNGLSLIAGFSVLLLTPLLLYVDVAKLMVSGLAVGMTFTLILLPEIAARRWKKDKLQGDA